MEIPAVYLRDLKFIVVGDIRTGDDLAIFFDHTLPDLHRELYAAAKVKWENAGMDVRPHGGGRFSVIGQKVIFFGKSQDFGRYEDQVVLHLAPQHPLFVRKNYEFYSKAGAESTREVLRLTNK